MRVESMFVVRGFGAVTVLVVRATVALLLLPLPALADGVVGTGSPASCIEGALDVALTSGGAVTFNCGGPATIVITSTKVISADTTIDGGGSLITISGGNAVRVIEVVPGVKLDLLNMKITEGLAPSNGGGIHSGGSLTLTNSTVSGNSTQGQGADIHNEDNLALTNTIVANNLGVQNCFDRFGGGITDGGNNLQFPGWDCGAAIPSTDPLLDPAGLQNNGGPTETIALQAGSPAIDAAGNCALLDPVVLLTDQRGVPRSDGLCDSGSYEFGIPVTVNQAPVALCQNVTVSANTSCQALASVDLGSFDPDGDPITLAQSPPEPYSLDDTLVELTVTDDQDASATCAATVSVVDDTAPALMIPSSITEECTSPAGAAIAFAATATDNCATPSILCTPNSGEVFPVGMTTVTCTASDSSGNATASAFDVTVTSTAPTITTALSGNPLLAPINTSVDFSVNFTDNSGDTHTATWDFDDTTSVVLVDPATSPLTISHTYTEQGIYDPSVTISDRCGNTVSDTCLGRGISMIPPASCSSIPRRVRSRSATHTLNRESTTRALP